MAYFPTQAWGARTPSAQDWRRFSGTPARARDEMRRSQRSYGFTGGRRSRSAATLHQQQQQRRPQSARPAGRGRSGSGSGMEEGYVHSLEAQIDELRSTLTQLQDTAQLSQQQQQQQYQQAVVPPELEAKVDQLAKVRHGV